MWFRNIRCAKETRDFRDRNLPVNQARKIKRRCPPMGTLSPNGYSSNFLRLLRAL